MTLTPSAIEELSRQIVMQFRPERIILFGSHAREEASAVSDVDLLIIMPVQGREIDKAIEMIRALNPPFALDLLVRTPQRLQERLDAGDFFLRDIIKQGRVLYESSDR